MSGVASGEGAVEVTGDVDGFAGWLVGADRVGVSLRFLVSRLFLRTRWSCRGVFRL